MFNKKTTILIALSLTLLNTHANAGFFDNLADNLKSGDIGSLLTDVVKDVALEAQKANDANQDAGTSFDSTAGYEEDEYAEGEYTEKGYKTSATINIPKKIVNPIQKKLVADTIEKEALIESLVPSREVRYEDLEYHYCIFCSDEEKGSIKKYFKNEKTPFSGIAIHKDGSKQLFLSGLLKMTKEYYPNSKNIHTKFNYRYDDKIKDYLQSGLTTSYHESGQVKTLAQWKDGKQEGLSKRFHENGQLTRERLFKNGKLDGLYQEWHENGQLKASENYSNGVKVGLVQEWHKNGQLSFKANSTINEIYVGLYEEWYENGQKKTEITYSVAGAEGLTQKWYENGNQKFKAYYIEGEKNGLTQKWYENGNKKLEQTVENGQIQFPYTEWFENGEVSMIHYGFPLAIPGTKFPAFDKFYNNGNPKESRKVIGKYLSIELFYENGNQRKAILGNLRGQPHQYQNTWYENGEMKIEEFYVEGDRKMQTMWDEDGSILETTDTGFRYSMVVDLEDLAKQ
jgi:antitoxin component YwqK of YwqJK toxin-antitoxin module